MTPRGGIYGSRFGDGSSTHLEYRDPPVKEDKGKQGGSCNVRACQQPGATWFNTSTRAYYCPGCAQKINRACADFREEPLCIAPQ